MTLDLHSYRTSTHWLSSNQLRLRLSAFGYMLLERPHAWGLAGPELAAATADKLRPRFLIIAAQITVSVRVRRVYVRLCSAYPLQALSRNARGGSPREPHLRPARATQREEKSAPMHRAPAASCVSAAHAKPPAPPKSKIPQANIGPTSSTKTFHSCPHTKFHF